MSSSVYGFVHVNRASVEAVRQLLDRLAANARIGCLPCTDDDLYNMALPPVASGQERVSFEISDRPGRHGAEYLLDNRDYAPEATIGLPIIGTQRASLITRLLNELLGSCTIHALQVALTDCGEVEREVHVERADLAQRVSDDLATNSPPNSVYVVDLP